LEDATYAPDFWDDREKAQSLLQRVTLLKERVSSYHELQELFDDTQALWQLACEADDESLEGEVAQGVHRCQSKMEHLSIALLFAGMYDTHGAIVSLHAGTGGTEAQDWVSMLLRMYMRYCERQGFKTEMMDMLVGDEAGIKSVTFAVDGLYAYGMLKSEKGVHRLVRISPFDASGRRHTSFASVEVMPQVAEENEVEINPDDLKIDTYRSGGAGGQHVNKTDSAVRITHLPTGIVVQCQDERSQHSNKDKAMKLLRSRLLEKKMLEQEAAMAEMRGEQQEIGWGSQIRSYIFQPYHLVKDHRTGAEGGNVEAVMDGELENFVRAYLELHKRKD